MQQALQPCLGDLPVALRSRQFARRLVARDLGVESLYLGHDSLLLEAYGALQLPVGLLQHRRSGTLDVGGELEPEIDLRELEIELLLGAGKFRTRLVDARGQRALRSGNPATRIDRPGRGDRRARAVQVRMEINRAQWSFRDAAGLRTELLRGAHGYLRQSQRVRRACLVVALADPSLARLVQIRNRLQRRPRILVGEGRGDGDFDTGRIGAK